MRRKLRHGIPGVRRKALPVFDGLHELNRNGGRSMILMILKRNCSRFMVLIRLRVCLSDGNISMSNPDEFSPQCAGVGNRRAFSSVSCRLNDSCKNERDWKISGRDWTVDRRGRRDVVVRIGKGLARAFARGHSLFKGRFSFLFSDRHVHCYQSPSNPDHVAGQKIGRHLPGTIDQSDPLKSPG